MLSSPSHCIHNLQPPSSWPNLASVHHALSQVRSRAAETQGRRRTSFRVSTATASAASAAD
eukprot:5584059-Alexandrium_andersonii.AAC.1